MSKKPKILHLVSYYSGQPPELFEKYKYYGKQYIVVERKFNDKEQCVEIYGVEKKLFRFDDWTGGKSKSDKKGKI